jgi:hypothetical protein
MKLGIREYARKLVQAVALLGLLIAQPPGGMPLRQPVVQDGALLCDAGRLVQRTQSVLQLAGGALLRGPVGYRRRVRHAGISLAGSMIIETKPDPLP